MSPLLLLAQIVVALSGLGLWIVGITAAAARRDRFLAGLVLLYTCASVQIAVGIAYAAVFRLDGLYLLLLRQESLGLWIPRALALTGTAADCVFLAAAATMAAGRVRAAGFRLPADLALGAAFLWIGAAVTVSVAGTLLALPPAADGALRASYLALLALLAAMVFLKSGGTAGVAELARRTAGAAAVSYLPLRLCLLVLDGTLKGGLSSAWFVSLDLLFFLVLNVRAYVHLALRMRGPGEDRDIGRFCRSFGFSAREEEVAALLLSRRSYKQIAAGLHISLDTVKSHARSIYRKTGRHDRDDLIALYRASP